MLTVSLAVLEADVSASPGEVRGERQSLRPGAGDVHDLIERVGVGHVVYAETV